MEHLYIMIYHITCGVEWEFATWEVVKYKQWIVIIICMYVLGYVFGMEYITKGHIAILGSVWQFNWWYNEQIMGKVSGE